MNYQKPKHSSYIEVSKSALVSNTNFIKGLLAPQTELSCVVKGNAYGHGIEKIVSIHVNETKIKHFCVYSADEAYRVKQVVNDDVKVLIMGYISRDSIDWVIANGVEFFVFDSSQMKPVLEATKRVGKPALIHIEVETGMNRTGFLMKNFKSLINYLKDNRDSIHVRGLCTHFAGAESMANHMRVKKQIAKYKKFQCVLSESGFKVDQYHTACSAAALRFKTMQMDLVRIGILQYGFWPNQETYTHHIIKNKLRKNPLKRVITWKTEIMTIKSVKKGEFVGYGNSFFANEDKLVAVIPVGYGHGFSRSLSNYARVLVGNDYCHVIGTVNMNAISIDVTHIENPQIGDEVVLIGAQGDKEITVASFSDFTDQLNYEVLTRLPESIPRVIVD